MKVVLPDGNELELGEGASGLDAARAIGPRLAEQAVLVRSNGSVQDLRAPLRDGQALRFLTVRDSDDPDALAVLRHSSAHLLAEAVRRLYPGVKVAIGPAIENGFYYDFAFPAPIGEDDLAAIEAEVARELREGRTWSRHGGRAGTGGLARCSPPSTSPTSSSSSRRAEGPIMLYTQSHAGREEFTDLCRGPHLQNSKPIKGFKLTSLAGAYWRGDEHNAQLTRIYGTAFYSQAELDDYLERLEEAKRRDHRRLGARLDLFHLSEHSPGSPFWHPKGMVIWNLLEDLRRRENAARGYAEVKTPLLYDVETYKTSGHYDNYAEHIFFVALQGGRRPPLRAQADELPRAHAPLRRAAALLPGAAPAGVADPPPRRAGGRALHGLLRVRHITQDDAHIFCTAEQIEDEIFGCLDYAAYLYDLFGLEARFELSTRPEKKVGSDAEWDFTEGALRAGLVRRGIDLHVVNEGDGAFYGPKIDLRMTDVLGRGWQMGTIQLDAQMPKRFGLTYMGADNAEHTPYVIHRALLGSLERFIGILIEHYGGDFPFWLAPVQVRVLPGGKGHREAAAGAGSSA